MRREVREWGYFFLMKRGSVNVIGMWNNHLGGFVNVIGMWNNHKGVRECPHILTFNNHAVGIQAQGI